MRSVPAIVAFAVLCACSEHDAPDDETEPLRSSTIAQITSVQEALQGAHIPTVDPQTMNEAEISKALGQRPYCSFRYTSAGKPVLAIDQAQTDGVVKLNGHLVALQNQASATPLSMTAGDVSLQMTFPDASQDGGAQAAEMREADLQFVIDRRLRVGYRGYYSCTT